MNAMKSLLYVAALTTLAATPRGLRAVETIGKREAAPATAGQHDRLGTIRLGTLLADLGLNPTLKTTENGEVYYSLEFRSGNWTIRH